MKGQFLFKSSLWLKIFWGWAILIVFLTAMPSNPDIIKQEKGTLIRLDYLEHMFFFAVLSMLHYISYLTGSGPVKKMNTILWLAAGILFASVTEIYQIFIPGRAYNPVDLGLNIAGLLAGIPLGKWVFKGLRMSGT